MEEKTLIPDINTADPEDIYNYLLSLYQEHLWGEITRYCATWKDDKVEGSPEWKKTHVRISGVWFRKPEGKYYEFLHHIAEQLFHNNKDYQPGAIINLLTRLEEDAIGGEFFLSEKYKGKRGDRPLSYLIRDRPWAVEIFRHTKEKDYLLNLSNSNIMNFARNKLKIEVEKKAKKEVEEEVEEEVGEEEVNSLKRKQAEKKVTPLKKQPRIGGKKTKKRKSKKRKSKKRKSKKRKSKKKKREKVKEK